MATRQWTDLTLWHTCIGGGSPPSEACAAPCGRGTVIFGAILAWESMYTRLDAVEAVSLRNICIVFRLQIYSTRFIVMILSSFSHGVPKQHVFALLYLPWHAGMSTTPNRDSSHEVATPEGLNCSQQRLCGVI